jgi:hypothetical protein
MIEMAKSLYFALVRFLEDHALPAAVCVFCFVMYQCKRFQSPAGV